MSNFSFLAADWSILAELGKQAEAYVVSDPVASLTKQRMFIETLVKTLFTLEKLPLEDQFELSQKIKDLEKLGVIEREFGYLFTAVRRAGNEAVHGNHGTEKIASENLKKVLVLANWFMETYGPLDFEPKEFNPAYLRQPTVGQASLEVAKALQAQKEKLEQEMQVSLRAQEEKFQEQLRLLQKQLSQKSEAELQAERVDRRQRPKRSLANLSELETRVLFVDEQLRQAGWEVDTEELDWRKGARPEKNKNKAIAEVVLPNGDRADYGLFIGLDLVGIVEAKKHDTPISSHLE
jgi:type I restriction enzyme R subunit